jgi:hypothetical protein
MWMRWILPALLLLALPAHAGTTTAIRTSQVTSRARAHLA